jgi:hypothetical protein
MKVLVGAHSMNFVPEQYRHRVGNLFQPGAFWKASPLNFALDNYVYSSWSKGQEWPEDKFIALLDKVKASGKTPSWVVCPDSVGDAAKSIALWKEWAPRLREYGWPLAFAVQDGQTGSLVPNDADVIFVGGTTEWKRATIKAWCANFPRVHVARINTYRWLWHCHECGAESIDGTGWFWKDKPKHYQLLDYLAITEGDQQCESGALFPIYPYSNPISGAAQAAASQSLFSKSTSAKAYTSASA